MYSIPKQSTFKIEKIQKKTKHYSTPIFSAHRQGIDTKISSLTNSRLKFETMLKSFQSYRKPSRIKRKKPKDILALLITLPKNYAEDNGYNCYSKDELEIYDRRILAGLNMSLG
jgi:hypothetical protein